MPNHQRWIEIRDDRDQRLLCKYDPERALLEFQHRRVKTLIDLTQYAGAAPRHQDSQSDTDRPHEPTGAGERTTNE